MSIPSVRYTEQTRNFSDSSLSRVDLPALEQVMNMIYDNPEQLLGKAVEKDNGKSVAALIVHGLFAGPGHPMRKYRGSEFLEDQALILKLADVLMRANITCFQKAETVLAVEDGVHVSLPEARAVEYEEPRFPGSDYVLGKGSDRL